jgi:hypothetical protein
MGSTRYSCQFLIELEFPSQIFEKYSNIKFHEKPSSGSRIVPFGRTDGRTDGPDRHVQAKLSLSAISRMRLKAFKNTQRDVGNQYINSHSRDV